MTTRSENGNDVIPAPEPEVKITMTTGSEIEKILMKKHNLVTSGRERVPGPEWSVASHEKSSKSK